MTASICLPGTSQPIPGKQASFYLTGGALALLAQALDLGWLAEAIAYVSGINFVLTDICNTDPPSDPGITARDVQCLFSPFDPTCDAGASIQKVAQLVEHLAWYQWCECVGATTPAAPPAPSAPTGIIQVNPPTIIQPGAPQLCYTNHVHLQPPYTLIAGSAYFTSPFPGIDFINPNCSGTPINHRNIPANPRPTFMQVTAGGDTVGGNVGTYSWNVTANRKSDCATSVLDFVNGAPNVQTKRPMVAIPSNVDEWYLGLFPNNGSSQTNGFDITIDLYCGGNGVGGNNTLGCCPPPADLITAIGDIRQLVTYLQRYMLPFATIDGAVHSGISGSGSFAVSRLIGMKIDLTTIPNYSGLSVANPNLVFDAGWVSMMTGDGVIIERRITHQTEQWMPRHFQDATTFGYYLNPGFVASFTEIEAEP